MNQALLRSTQIRVTLSVHLELDSPDGSQLMMLLLWSLTWLAMMLWKGRLWIGWLRYELAMFWRDVNEAINFTFKVFSIAFNSVTFGLGVRL